LDESVFLRQIRQESGFNPNAVSPAGAIGIAQIMPATARGWGVNPHDPHASLNAAAKNMASYVKKYGSYRNALIAYNAGPGAVGRGSLPAETQNYIKTILGGRTPGTGSVRSGSGGGGGSGGSTSSDGSTTTTTTGQPDLGAQPSALPLIEALTQSQQQAPPSASIQAPAFAAHAVMPAGFGTVSGGSGPAPRPDIGALAAAVKTLGGSVPAAGQQVTQSQQQGVSGAAGSGSPSGGRLQTNGYPLGRTGKIIGTPFTGTHTLGDWQSDRAVDIATPVGTPMVALEGGTVVKVRHHPQDGGRFAGDQITIRGSNNSYFYAHGVASVKPGQKVHRGDVIGKSGSANGVAHLHFGVERGDPRNIIRGR
jgi:murein DD-endopeptidase MepM/ murein hydrolase activator NlpD